MKKYTKEKLLFLIKESLNQDLPKWHDLKVRFIDL